MGRYTYTAQDAQGTVTTGEVASEDEDAAVQYLQSNGFCILSIKEEGAGKHYLPDAVKKIRGGIPAARWFSSASSCPHLLPAAFLLCARFPY